MKSDTQSVQQMIRLVFDPFTLYFVNLQCNYWYANDMNIKNLLALSPPFAVARC